MYQGDGSNNVFSVPMTKGKYGTISVAFVRRGLSNYIYNPTTFTLNGGLYAWSIAGNLFYTDTPTPAVNATVYNQYSTATGYTVTAAAGSTITISNGTDTLTLARQSSSDIDENTLLTWTGETLQIGDYIVIERNTVRQQPFEFQNNQKHIEKSDDNQERQIQEIADKVANALLVDPTHTIDSRKMNPINWMNTIVRCVDLSVRALRYSNGWLDYSLDDPNIADGDKTWTHLLNTDNIKGIKERKEIIDDVEHRWVEYLDQDGIWHTVSDSAWDDRITEAERIANEAHDLAEEALSEAGEANTKSDQALDYATQAQTAVANIYSERFVFNMTAGQTGLLFDESIEDKIVDLYWNGQLLSQPGNYTISGDTINLLFPIETGDVIVVMLGVIRQVINYMDLTAHNTDPTAHANIISAHNTNSSAHANLIATHNADANAHANTISSAVSAHATSASAHAGLFNAKATKVIVRRW